MFMVEDTAENVTDQVPSWESLERLQNQASAAAVVGVGKSGSLSRACICTAKAVSPVTQNLGGPCDTPRFPLGPASTPVLTRQII